jgi:hypothetical protein
MSPADVAAAVAAAGLPALAAGTGVLVREGRPEAKACLSAFHMGDITGNHVKLFELVSRKYRLFGHLGAMGLKVHVVCMVMWYAWSCGVLSWCQAGRAAVLCEARMIYICGRHCLGGEGGCGE